MNKIRENWLTGVRYGMLVLLVVFVAVLTGADRESSTPVEAVEQAVAGQVPWRRCTRKGARW